MTKAELRKQLRAARKVHVAEQPNAVKALLFNRPPRPLLEKIPAEAVIGLYHAVGSEAPAAAYARHFHESGHTIALPAFDDEQAAMDFREFTDPIGESDLEDAPFGIRQPCPKNSILKPDVLFVPLIGFTARGVRLGQGGGHYDRWLSAHPYGIAIGLAWDSQLCEEIPSEPHDIRLDAIVTPTRIYGPF